MRYELQSRTTDLDRQFNKDVQQLLRDYQGLAGNVANLPSASMLGSAASVLGDVFNLAYRNLTASRAEKARLLLERYDRDVRDYLSPKGEQAMTYARSIMDISVLSYGQFVMRLGSFLSQLQNAAASCVAHYVKPSGADTEDVDTACFKREVQILEDFTYQLILNCTGYLDKARMINSATTATATASSSTPSASTALPPTTATSSAPSSSTTVEVKTEPVPVGPALIISMAGSGSGDAGDQETTKPPNPSNLPSDDEDFASDTSTLYHIRE